MYCLYFLSTEGKGCVFAHENDCSCSSWDRERRHSPNKPFPPAHSVRQNLKEKQARHIADLRAYYESEISSLKQKLEAKEMSAVEDLKKTNQILVDR